MALTANKKDYRNAFTKHLHTLNNWKDTGSKCSKRLILVYSVECGLKYLLLSKKKVNTASELSDEHVKETIFSHDLQELLKLINWSESFRNFETNHNDVVTCRSFHEFCRYSIGAKNIANVIAFEQKLEHILKNIEEEMLYV